VAGAGAAPAAPARALPGRGSPGDGRSMRYVLSLSRKWALRAANCLESAAPSLATTDKAHALSKAGMGVGASLSATRSPARRQIPPESTRATLLASPPGVSSSISTTRGAWQTRRTGLLRGGQRGRGRDPPAVTTWTTSRSGEGGAVSRGGVSRVLVRTSPLSSRSSFSPRSLSSVVPRAAAAGRRARRTPAWTRPAALPRDHPSHPPRSPVSIAARSRHGGGRRSGPGTRPRPRGKCLRRRSGSRITSHGTSARTSGRGRSFEGG